jgi:hypothetical protein
VQDQNQGIWAFEGLAVDRIAGSHDKPWSGLKTPHADDMRAKQMFRRLGL